MINVKLLTKGAQLPMRSNPSDAGLDLRIDSHATVLPGQRALLPTGLALEIPLGFVGLIWPRSKLAAKYGLDTLAGVVDADYRGEVMVSVINHGADTIELKAGDKVAQLLIQPVALDSCAAVDELSDTARGKAGVNDSELRLR